eukprot:scaffold220_cov430-Prasinococcus_capsulatus_cf.AAC.4
MAGRDAEPMLITTSETLPTMAGGPGYGVCDWRSSSTVGALVPGEARLVRRRACRLGAPQGG